MKNLSAYTFLILLYLGLSKTLTQVEKDYFELPATNTGVESLSYQSQKHHKNIPFIKNREMLSSVFKGAPLSVILIDVITTGLVIKTYYHKYKVLDFSEQPKIVTVKVTPEFAAANMAYIGLTLFRRHENNKLTSTTPMPPGILFIGIKKYGHWKEERGQKVWKFKKQYSHYPGHFGWIDFVPNFLFFQKAKIHLSKNRPFFGQNGEFGTAGKITQASFPWYFQKKDRSLNSFKDTLIKIFKSSFQWKSHERTL